MAMTMRNSGSLLRAAAVLAAAVLTGCKDTSMPHPPTTVDPVSSAAVIGVVGQLVADSSAVKVTDSDGFPVPGVEVQWITQPGSGSVSPTTSITNSDGIAKTQWRLGTTAGTQSMYAAVSLVSDEAQFTATAGPGPASTITVTPAPLSLLVGEQRALTVTVRDQYGNPVSVQPPYTLSSSAPAVVSTSGTTVTGNSAGTATVTATVSGLGSAPTTVTVTRPVIASLSQGGNSEAMCALDTAGNAFCWGYSDFYAAGQAGGNAVDPRMIAGGHHFAKVSTNGLGVSCGLEGGMVFCWGQVGQSGGQAVLSVTPVLAAGPTNMTDIAFGRHACAIQAQATVYCWPAYINTDPTQAIAGGPFFALSGSASETCALKAANTAWCWGDNTDLQLGRDETGCTAAGAPRTYDCPVPAPVTNAQYYQKIRTGLNNTCGQASDNSWYCWGRADYNLLQQPEPKVCRLQVNLFNNLDTCTAAPVLMNTTPPLVSLTPGWDAICGLTSAGQAYCWGAGVSGQLGNGSTADNGTPTAVAGGHTFTSLASGGYFFCGIDTAGQVWCWGQNDHGQLGDGTTTDRSIPVAVF